MVTSLPGRRIAMSLVVSISSVPSLNVVIPVPTQFFQHLLSTSASAHVKFKVHDPVILKSLQTGMPDFPARAPVVLAANKPVMLHGIAPIGKAVPKRRHASKALLRLLSKRTVPEVQASHGSESFWTLERPSI